MKKQSLLLLLLPLLLAGCADNGNAGTSKTDVENSSTQVETSTKVEESSTQTSTPIPLPPAQVKNIAQIKEIGKTYNEKVNDYGIYISNSRVKLQNVQLVAAVNTVSGKQQFEGDKLVYNYKLIMSDNEGNIINVACDFATYEKCSEYESKNQRYDVTGFVGYFNNQVEVFAGTKEVEYLSDEQSIDIPFASKAGDAITIEEFNSLGEALVLNDKGIVYSDKLVSLKVKCVSDDVSKSHQTNAIFAAGDYILHAHSDRYFTNTLSKDKNYLVTGIVSVYKYRVSIEVAAVKEIQEDIAFNATNATPIELNDINKNYYYEADSKLAHPTNLKYTQFLEKPFKTRGYFGFIEGNELKSVLDDKPLKPTKDKDGHEIWLSVSQANEKDVIYVHGKTYAGVDLYDPEDTTKLWGNIGALLEITFLPYECQTGKNHTMKCYPYSFEVVTPVIHD